MPDRVRWAVDHLDVAPEARLLEVGCGPGAAAALLCERLPRGHLLAVDRSATAVRRTTERNAGHLDAGRLEVVAAALADLDVEPASVDDAFAVNVNVFWVGHAEREVGVLRDVVRPDGRVHLVYGAGGPSQQPRVVDSAAQALRDGGFTDVEVTPGDVAFAICASRPGALHR